MEIEQLEIILTVMCKNCDVTEAVEGTELCVYCTPL